MSTISVYYCSMCTTLVLHLLLVCITLVLLVCTTLVLFVCTTFSTICLLLLVLFLCTTLVLFTTHKWSHLGVARHLGVTERGCIQIFNFSAPLGHS